MKRVFVSYSRRNKTFAERLARDLSDAGLEVWIDFRQIQGGERWRDEIQRGLDKSDYLIVCLSPDAIRSEWVAREANTARDQGKPVIPIMAAQAFTELEQSQTLNWLLDVQFINFDGRYEQALPELFAALPGMRAPDGFREIDPASIPNPFKGLEAFQQTDAHLFFGRETMIRRLVAHLGSPHSAQFAAVVGGSGTGKSSIVRAGLIPAVRDGEIPGSENWQIAIFAPGDHPVQALAERLLPLARKHVADARREEDSTHEKSGDERQQALEELTQVLATAPENLERVVSVGLKDSAPDARLLLVVDQFEEVFTRAGEVERGQFLAALQHSARAAQGRAFILVTMRADFFSNLSQYPDLASLFEGDNLFIVTAMTPRDLRRAIEGPAGAVGLVYDAGLVERILEDVRAEPGALPLLQYALKELYLLRDGRRLTTKAYDEIGGVRKALAKHAEGIYTRLNSAQQDIMRRLLLRLVEISASGEATRRRVERAELTFRSVSYNAVQEVIDLLTAPESRLLIASRRIDPRMGVDSPAATTIEVGHEALIREWERFTGWVAADKEALRYGTEILQAAQDWQNAGRDASYLLRDNRLVRAQLWQENADANELQRQFIQVSDDAQQRRELLRRRNQRRVVVGSLLFGIVSLVLAVLAVFGFAQAQQNAETAARQSARANSLALATGAQQALADNNTDLAVLLALEANPAPSSLLPEAPPQAQRALADAAYAPGTRSVLTGHSAGVTNLVVSTDGALALSGSDDQTLILWNLATGEPLLRFGGAPVPTDQSTPPPVQHSGVILSVALSRDRQRALSSANDATVILWDAMSGRAIMPIGSTQRTLPVTAVAFTPDDQQAITGGGDGTINIWDTQTGALLRSLPQNHDGAVTSIAFSTDGTLMISASVDGVALVWDYASGTVLNRLVNALTSQGVYSVTISPDNQFILTANGDTTVIVWDAATGSALRTLVGHDDQVNAVAFSPDGTLALSASDDSSLIMWEISTGRLVRRFLGHDGRVTGIAFTPGGRLAVSGASDGTLRVWDTENLALVRQYTEHTSRILHTNFTIDGAEGYAATADGLLVVWDIDTGANLRQLPIGGRLRAVTTAPAANLLLAALLTDELVFIDTETGDSQVINPAEAAVVHRDKIAGVTLSADGTLALTTSNDTSMILWNVADGSAVRGFGTAFQMSAPGERSAAAQTTVGHSATVYNAVFSPDNALIASVGGDGLVILWDTNTGEQLRRLSGHTAEVLDAAFSPDGTRLASAGEDENIIIWDVANGTALQTLSGHTGAINDVTFSADGRFVLSGSSDGTLRMWDIARLAELRRFDREGVRFLSIAVSPDGQNALTGGSDRALTLWRVFPDQTDLLQWVLDNRFVREFTCAERLQYDIQPLCAAEITLTGQ